MISAVRHTGLVVVDIGISLKLYREILGLTVFKQADEEGDYIEKVVGIEKAKLKWVKLKAPDGYLIELLQYTHPKPAAAQPANSMSNTIGCLHVAFTVKDIDVLYRVLTEKGYRCNAVPQLSPDNKAKVMYFHDNDGIIIELVEEIE
jgi:catechol 2,3-dioxygenase-like lactoylglutathione lyase family enzyme